MSTISKVTLGTSIAFAIGMISFVHVWQKKERERLHEGVLRDLERQQRKLANIKEMEEQAELTRIMREQQEEVREQT